MRLKNIVMIGLLISSLASIGCIQQEVVDSDGDGWSDEQELNAGTDPDKRDTDGDGYWDPMDENPLDPDIPVARETPAQVETVQPTPAATPTPTPVFEITSPEDGGIVARVITVKGYGGEPGAKVRIHVHTEEEGDQLQDILGYPDENGYWEVDPVYLWPVEGYIAGDEAVIYAEMTVSKPGVTCTYRSTNVTVRRS